jgi:hypothetical protein
MIQQKETLMQQKAASRGNLKFKFDLMGEKEI